MANIPSGPYVAPYFKIVDLRFRAAMEGLIQETQEDDNKTIKSDESANGDAEENDKDKDSDCAGKASGF